MSDMCDPSVPCDCTRHWHCPRCHGISIVAERDRPWWCLECGNRFDGFVSWRGVDGGHSEHPELTTPANEKDRR